MAKDTSPGKAEKKRKIEHIRHVLEDLVQVNSFFSFAMFVGISFASSNPKTLNLREECQADQQTKMTLMFDEVVSFACFLLSSLVATAIKMDLSTYLMSDESNGKKPKGQELKDGLMGLMVIASLSGAFLGCVYLTLSMVNIVRILLGSIKCGERDTLEATASLITINTLALLIYAPSVARAVALSFVNLTQHKK